MKRTILILGAKGMLGQELVETFRDDEEVDLTAWDKEDLDVTDEVSLGSRITNLWPDIVYNCVAYNAVDACQNDPEEAEKARRLNAIFPGKLAQITESLQSTIVHYSTDYVFDGARPRYRSGNAPGCCGKGCNGCSYKGPGDAFDGYREEDLPHPLSVYGSTKYAGERAVEKNSSNFYIIRLSKLFGKPASSPGSKRSFFDVMLEKGRGGDQEVSVVNDEIANFTYAPDLAKASGKLVDGAMTSGIYHLVNSGACSWYDAVCQLYRLAGIHKHVRAVSSSEFPRPAPRPKYSALVNKKAEPLRSYVEALEEFVARSQV